MDDFEGVFENEISRFIWAKCHIKPNHAIYKMSLNSFSQELVINNFGTSHEEQTWAYFDLYRLI